MKTERKDRKRKFNTMLDNSRNVVADELLFTSTNIFFRNMSNEDLSYTKEQILHATPHIHCVIVTLVNFKIFFHNHFSL